MLLAQFSTPMGAYTSNSKGHQTIRKEIANYISKRDGVEANPNNIFMTNGASEGVRICFKMIARNYK
jgi:aspartate/methionine/tyrosine aminotransferase